MDVYLFNVRYFRTTLLHIRAPNKGHNVGPDVPRQQILAFLRHQNAIDMNKFIHWVKIIGKETPSDLLPTPKWPGQAAATAVTATDQVAFPIPRGESYPAFLHFPKFVVNFQLQERERIQLEEEELRRKQRLMKDLEAKTYVWMQSV